MTDWIETYTPLIGRKLEALIWMPMTSDTPQLASEYKSAAFSFTGATFLAFEDRDLFLTWRQVGRNVVLGAGRDLAWMKYALDRVRCDANEPWAAVEQSTLQSVDLFTAPFVDDERVVGIRHAVISDRATSHFWIGSGGPDFIGDGDDLWVGVGLEPPNFVDLIPVGTVAR